MTNLDCFIKRGADIVLSFLSLLLFFIPILFLCLCIKLEDGGAPIFKQERVGKDGKPFRLYKLRSMKVDAEKDKKPQLYCKGDKRQTKIGGFIRKHHLDELPQLWNIFVGDMSFVGYRPERKFYIDQISRYCPQYTDLYQMRPGVFSSATLYNGYTDTIEKMVIRTNMDLEYLRNGTLWTDTKIILLTTVAIVTGKRF